MPAAGHQAFLIARLAGAADVRAVCINAARGFRPDNALERAAPVANAAHAGTRRRDEACGNARDLGIAFQ